MAFVDLHAQAKKHRKAQGVEGHKANVRLDRRAKGGATRATFNAAINDQPARPTIDEDASLPAVHARKHGGEVHDDEPEDRALVKKMVKRDALTGRKEGGKLTAAERHKLPAKDFALGAGRYPIEDKSHARNALARVSQHGTPEEKAKVRAAVHRKYPEIGKK